MLRREHHDHDHDHDPERAEEILLAVIAEFLEAIHAQLAELLALLKKFATTAKIFLGGTMSVQVGSTGPATLTFVDNTGTPAAAPAGDGSGLVVTFATSDAGIATVGAATQTSPSSYSADVTGVGAGDYQLSAVVANTSGAPLLDDDGTTPFVQPADVTGTVNAVVPVPQAVTATLTAP